jgi:hypothetical protein
MTPHVYRCYVALQLYADQCSETCVSLQHACYSAAPIYIVDSCTALDACVEHDAAAGCFADSCANSNAQLQCTVHTATEHAVRLIHKEAHLVLTYPTLLSTCNTHSMLYHTVYVHDICVCTGTQFRFQKSSKQASGNGQCTVYE